MEGQKVTHLRLLILLLAMALTISSDGKRVVTSREAHVDDEDAGKRNKISSYNRVVMNDKRNLYNGGGGGGGGGGIGGGGGWGWGGGGGGWWGWGCRRQEIYNGRGSGKMGNYDNHNGNHHVHKNERGTTTEYIMGEYAQCMGRGRCRWRRLDCPLHCGGACFYDCKHMCKPHCRR